MQHCPVYDRRSTRHGESGTPMQATATSLSINAPACEACNPAPPAQPVKLIFIHHSCGENWLDDRNGGLGIALRDNNYFVSDTNYGWGSVPEGGSVPIGSLTDIGFWWTWFRGPQSAEIMDAVYSESGQHADYSRLNPDSGGKNGLSCSNPVSRTQTSKEILMTRYRPLMQTR